MEVLNRGGDFVRNRRIRDCFSRRRFRIQPVFFDMLSEGFRQYYEPGRNRERGRGEAGKPDGFAPAFRAVFRA
jgi:hypothetical protein